MPSDAATQGARRAAGTRARTDGRGACATFGVATLFFLVGGVGSAVVGGLGDVLGMPGALLLLTMLPLAGIAALIPQLGRDPAGTPGRLSIPS